MRSTRVRMDWIRSLVFFAVSKTESNLVCVCECVSVCANECWIDAGESRNETKGRIVKKMWDSALQFGGNQGKGGQLVQETVHGVHVGALEQFLFDRYIT